MNNPISEVVEIVQDSKSANLAKNEHSQTLFKDLSVDIEKLPSILVNRYSSYPNPINTHVISQSDSLEKNFCSEIVPLAPSVLENHHSFPVCKNPCVLLEKLPTDVLEDRHMETPAIVIHKAEKCCMLPNNVKKFRRAKCKVSGEQRLPCDKVENSFQRQELNCIPANMHQHSKPLKSKNNINNCKTGHIQLQTEQNRKLKKLKSNKSVKFSSADNNYECKNFKTNGSKIKLSASMPCTEDKFLSRGTLDFISSSVNCETGARSCNIVNFNSNTNVDNYMEQSECTNFGNVAVLPENSNKISVILEDFEQLHSFNKKPSLILQKLPDVFLNEYADDNFISVRHTNNSLQHSINHFSDVGLSTKYETSENGMDNVQHTFNKASPMVLPNVSTLQEVSLDVNPNLLPHKIFHNVNYTDIPYSENKTALNKESNVFPLKELTVKIPKLPDALYNESTERMQHICMKNSENCGRSDDAKVKSFPQTVEISHQPSLTHQLENFNDSSSPKETLSLGGLPNELMQREISAHVFNVHLSNSPSLNIKVNEKKSSFSKKPYVIVRKLPSVLIDKYIKRQYTSTKSPEKAVHSSLDQNKPSNEKEIFMHFETSENNLDSSSYSFDGLHGSSIFQTENFSNNSILKQPTVLLEKLPDNLIQSAKSASVCKTNCNASSTSNVKRSDQKDFLFLPKEPSSKHIEKETVSQNSKLLPRALSIPYSERLSNVSALKEVTVALERLPDSLIQKINLAHDGEVKYQNLTLNVEQKENLFCPNESSIAVQSYHVSHDKYLEEECVSSIEVAGNLFEPSDAYQNDRIDEKYLHIERSEDDNINSIYTGEVSHQASFLQQSEKFSNVSGLEEAVLEKHLDDSPQNQKAAFSYNVYKKHDSLRSGQSEETNFSFNLEELSINIDTLSDVSCDKHSRSKSAIFTNADDLVLSSNMCNAGANTVKYPDACESVDEAERCLRMETSESDYINSTYSSVSPQTPSNNQSEKFSDLSKVKAIVVLETLPDDFAQNHEAAHMSDVYNVHDSSRNKVSEKKDLAFPPKKMSVNPYRFPNGLSENTCENRSIFLRIAADGPVQFPDICNAAESAVHSPYNGEENSDTQSSDTCSAIKNSFLTSPGANESIAEPERCMYFGASESRGDNSSAYISGVSSKTLPIFRNKKLSDNFVLKEATVSLERLPDNVIQNALSCNIRETNLKDILLNVKNTEKNDFPFFPKQVHIKMPFLENPDDLFDKYIEGKSVPVTNSAIQHSTQEQLDNPIKHPLDTYKSTELCTKDVCNVVSMNLPFVSSSEVSHLPLSCSAHSGKVTNIFATEENAVLLKPHTNNPLQSEKLIDVCNINCGRNSAVKVSSENNHCIFSALTIASQKLPVVAVNKADIEKELPSFSKVDSSVGLSLTEGYGQAFKESQLVNKGVDFKTSENNSIELSLQTSGVSRESLQRMQPEEGSDVSAENVSVLLEKVSTGTVDHWCSKEETVSPKKKRKSVRFSENLVSVDYINSEHDGLENGKPEISPNKNTLRACKFFSDNHISKSRKTGKIKLKKAIISSNVKDIQPEERQNFEYPAITDKAFYEEPDNFLNCNERCEENRVGEREKYSKSPASGRCRYKSVDHTYASSTEASCDILPKHSSSKLNVEHHVLSKDENHTITSFEKIECTTGVLFNTSIPSSKKKTRHNSKDYCHIYGLLSTESSVRKTHLHCLRKKKIRHLVNQLRKLKNVTHESAKQLK